MNMKQLNEFSADQVRTVIATFTKRYRFVPTNAEVNAAFAMVSPIKPQMPVIREIRAMLETERVKIMQSLCDQFSRAFDWEPKPKDLSGALNGAVSRHFISELLDMLRQQNAQRWALAAKTEKKIRVRLVDGEGAMWYALSRTYNISHNDVASLLLRVYAVATSTGKIDPLEVPYLVTVFSDNDLKKFAEKLNFTVKKTRKSSVSPTSKSKENLNA